MPSIQSASPSSSSALRRIGSSTDVRVPDSSEANAHVDTTHSDAPNDAPNDAHVWRKIIGAGFACVGAGLATYAVSTMTPLQTRMPPAPITRPSPVPMPPAPSTNGPVIVVVPPSVPSSPANNAAQPSQPAPSTQAPATPAAPSTSTPTPPPATHTPSPPPQHATPPQTTTPPQTPPQTQPVTAPVVQPVTPKPAGVFAFAPLPQNARLGVSGTFTTTIVFGPTAINFTGSAQALKSDANNLVLRVAGTGTDGIFRGQSRTVDLSFTKVDAKHVRFSAQVEGDASSDSSATLTVVGSTPTTTTLRAPDGSTVSLDDKAGTLTIHYDQNVIRVAHPAARNVNRV